MELNKAREAATFGRQTFDHAVIACRTMRHWEHVADRHLLAQEMKLYGAARWAAVVAEQEFRQAPPTTWRGVLLKAHMAIFYLAASQDFTTLEVVRTFFRRPRRPVDGEWIADLRALVECVQRSAEEPQKATECIWSIIGGVAGPRKASW